MTEYTRQMHEKIMKIYRRETIRQYLWASIGFFPPAGALLMMIPLKDKVLSLFSNGSGNFAILAAIFTAISTFAVSGTAAMGLFGISGVRVEREIEKILFTVALIYCAMFHRNWKNIFLVSGIRKLFPEAVISFAFINECLDRLERTPPFMRESLYKIFKMEYEKAVNFKFLSNNHKLEMKLLHYSKFDDLLVAKIIERNVTKRLEKKEKEKIEKKNEAERMYREYLEEHSLPEFLDTGKDD